MYFLCMYKRGLILNDLQVLICHKSQTNKPFTEMQLAFFMTPDDWVVVVFNFQAIPDSSKMTFSYQPFGVHDWFGIGCGVWVTFGWEGLMRSPGRPSSRIFRAWQTKSLGLRRPPHQALPLLGGAKFIACCLRHPFLGESRQGPRHFCARQMYLDYDARYGSTKKSSLCHTRWFCEASDKYLVLIPKSFFWVKLKNWKKTLVNWITMNRKSGKHLHATYGSTGQLFRPY